MSAELLKWEAFCEAVDRELATMEQQHSAAFHQCHAITDREARDWLRAKAKELGFDGLTLEITHLNRDQLKDAGRMLAIHMFQHSKAARDCYDCPALVLWAMLDGSEIAEILRCLWVPKLIDRKLDLTRAACS